MVHARSGVKPGCDRGTVTAGAAGVEALARGTAWLGLEATAVDAVDAELEAKAVGAGAGPREPQAVSTMHPEITSARLIT